MTILTAVERDAPQTVGLGDAFEALVGALASSVRAVVARSDWPAAESGVKALESMGHAPALTSSLARDLAVARLQEDYLATASSAGDLTLVTPWRPSIRPTRSFGRSRAGSRSSTWSTAAG